MKVKKRNLKRENIKYINGVDKRENFLKNHLLFKLSAFTNYISTPTFKFKRLISKKGGFSNEMSLNGGVVEKIIGDKNLFLLKIRREAVKNFLINSDKFLRIEKVSIGLLKRIELSLFINKTTLKNNLFISKTLRKIRKKFIKI